MVEGGKTEGTTEGATVPLEVVVGPARSTKVGVVVWLALVPTPRDSPARDSKGGGVTSVVAVAEERDPGGDTNLERLVTLGPQQSSSVLALSLWRCGSLFGEHSGSSSEATPFKVTFVCSTSTETPEKYSLPRITNNSTDVGMSIDV